MRKALKILIPVLCAIAVLAWCHKTNQYTLAQPNSCISNVEIVHVPSHTIVDDGAYEKIVVTATIPDDQIPSFLDDFSRVPSKKDFGHPAYYVEGNVVRITYSDGAFELIGKYAGFYATSSGETDYIDYHFTVSRFEQFISEQLLKYASGA